MSEVYQAQCASILFTEDTTSTFKGLIKKAHFRIVFTLIPTLQILAPGGLAVAESGKYMLQLNKEQAQAFAGGWA